MIVFYSFSQIDEEFLKQENDTDISGEYVEEEKPYQTEGDGEIGTYESGSQDNGKYSTVTKNEFLSFPSLFPRIPGISRRTMNSKINFQIISILADKTDEDFDKPKLATQAELGIKIAFFYLRFHYLSMEN